ncbi:MAG TPA: hypothetical protein VME17_01840 [Bryobacteraceae bacterium]|nr:hypothetical protein [Bryobacteraceae bacterium]
MVRNGISRRGRGAELLLDGQIIMHPFVIGEIACGNLKSRKSVLSDLRRLPSAIVADQVEVLGFLELYRLFGKGIPWVDVHLLASTRLSGCRLWTLDKTLAAAATQLRIRYSAES